MIWDFGPDKVTGWSVFTPSEVLHNGVHFVAISQTGEQIGVGWSAAQQETRCSVWLVFMIVENIPRSGIRRLVLLISVYLGRRTTSHYVNVSFISLKTTGPSRIFRLQQFDFEDMQMELAAWSSTCLGFCVVFWE